MYRVLVSRYVNTLTIKSSKLFVIQRSRIPERALNSEGSQASAVCHCGKEQNVEED
jgi:hypothetical protein